MRGRKLAIFLALILLTLFVCKTFLPSGGGEASTTAALAEQAATN